VHPNRKFNARVRGGQIDPFASRLEYFFDPEVMDKYRPDYVSEKEYRSRIAASPLRLALINAAAITGTETLINPVLRFVKTSDAQLATELARAQQKAALVTPELERLLQILRTGQQHRDKEASPRWLAGFDLSLGTVLAHRVRAASYNSMLARAKRGMKFTNARNNTWLLKRVDDIDVGRAIEKEAELAKELLTGVAQKHKGTPWGLLAERELRIPIGWEWTEEFTDLNPPQNNRPGNNNNNNVPRPARDDQARMLEKAKPRKALPKL
jgi:hypothetical protein